ncbi:YdeI/OmpD-associated family protein [Mucilaginibacter lacusdianchii]|uniref:YdeI/OmpD-associated family protein n=1 Tax=Mucilaginibacter lacusdianchii TaxID=2684211 RepID=UPI00131B968C|nr:YdeI/OmpD-associated family protein [Mucilaginibacter sp. JXJ CY 39]
MKPRQQWLLYNAPENYHPMLDPVPDGLTFVYKATGEFDGIQLFAKDSTELPAGLLVIHPLLNAETVFWIIYPKKSSGMKTDLEMMGSWDEPAKYGLGIVTAAAIDATWTGLRFRPVEQSKVSVTRNSEIGKTEFGEYIDVANKKITLPAVVLQMLQKEPSALSFFESLSYTNKKEYVLWILTAKQEKTREDRLIKMVDKLLSGKKNPSEK